MTTCLSAPRYFHAIAEALGREPWVRTVKAFPTAYVPIIKVTTLSSDPESLRRPIKLDITFQTPSHRCARHGSSSLVIAVVGHVIIV